MELDLEEIRNDAIQAFWVSVENSMPDQTIESLSTLVVDSFDNYADELIYSVLESNK